MPTLIFLLYFTMIEVGKMNLVGVRLVDICFWEGLGTVVSLVDVN